MKLGLFIRSSIAAAAVSSAALATPPITGTPSVNLGTIVTRVPQRENSPPELINYADCKADGIIQFAVNPAFVTGDLNIQVWAQDGATCTDDMVRRTGTGCWQVGQVVQASTEVDIRVRDIIGQTSVPPAATEMVCDMPMSSRSDFVLAFLIVNNSGVFQTETTPAIWPPSGNAIYDVEGPPPPTNLTASPGGGSAIISFDASSNPDGDLDGYTAFCAPAGVATDAGDCEVTDLVPGQRPTVAPCGDGSTTSTEVTAEGLEDGTAYVIGVTSTDRLENNGPLSELVCVTPKPTTGYFEAYRAAGGTAGGGFCSLSRRPSPFAAGAILVALASLVSRRRRRS